MGKLKKPSAKKPELNGSGYCVYIGPSIRGVVQYGQVIAGEKQDAFNKLADGIEKFPLIKKLIVTGAELPSANELIKKPGCALFDAKKRLTLELQKH